MGKTLEEIKGMNIPVGTPIEIILKNSKYKQIGYFVDSEKEKGVIRYTLDQKVSNPITQEDEIIYRLTLKSEFERDIEDIKILKGDEK
jgi:hypothetical protein